MTFAGGDNCCWRQLILSLEALSIALSAKLMSKRFRLWPFSGAGKLNQGLELS
jgi:hypothetical protein